MFRLCSAPWGLAGGLDGGKVHFCFSPGTAPFHLGQGTLLPGQIVEVITAGSGGYGVPAQRTAEAVHRDIAESAIDPESAREIYGGR